MNKHRNAMIAALVALAVMLAYSGAVAALCEEGVALDLEITPRKTSITVGENFCLDITIRNNNGTAVEVRGISTNGKGIRLTASGDSGSWRWPEPVHVMDGTGPIVLGPGEAIRAMRFAHPELSTTNRWPNVPGRVVVRASFMQVMGRFVGEENWRAVSPKQEPVTTVVDVVQRSEADRRAAEALESQLVTVTAQGGQDYSKGVVDTFARFLREHGDSVLVSEVRFNLAVFVVELLGNEADVVQESELPEYVNLMEENVSWCIRQGRPFSDIFTLWRWDRGGNEVFELAIVHGKRQFLRELCDALDSAPTADVPTRLFRRAAVLKLEGKSEEAMSVVRQLEREWPTHKATENASNLLR